MTVKKDIYHCELCITRTAAPDTKWWWFVIMPDGHIYNMSGADQTHPDLTIVMEDAATRGMVALAEADFHWRKHHPPGKA